MKQNVILINANSSYIRIAQVIKGSLFNLHWENCSNLSQVGSIYKARINKIQQGIEACFMDIGSDKIAFLYTGKKTFNKSFIQPLKPEEPIKKEVMSLDTSTIRGDIDIKNLKQDQKFMVQVVKDPIKGKTLRVSHKISLPGLYLVYLPNSQPHIGISRQIEDKKIREKLTQYIQQLDLQEAVIVRTKAAHATLKELKKDLDNLKKLWKNIQEKYKNQETTGSIWSDSPFFAHIFKTFLTDEIQQIFIDDKKMFLFFQKWADKNLLEGTYKISHYQDNKIPLFDKYDLEPQLKKLLRKKVILKSGGCIVIEEAEAAVIVDVNTGRFIGKKTQAENILKINKEAAVAIAYQIRLRNCGGIILIDFIDMETLSDRKQVMATLLEELKKDHVPTELFPMSDLAIVQITRKRVQSSLLETVCKPCSQCGARSYY